MANWGECMNGMANWGECMYGMANWGECMYGMANWGECMYGMANWGECMYGMANWGECMYGIANWGECMYGMANWGECMYGMANWGECIAKIRPLMVCKVCNWPYTVNSNDYRCDHHNGIKQNVCHHHIVHFTTPESVCCRCQALTNRVNRLPPARALARPPIGQRLLYIRRYKAHAATPLHNTGKGVDINILDSTRIQKKGRHASTWPLLCDGPTGGMSFGKRTQDKLFKENADITFVEPSRDDAKSGGYEIDSDINT
ncbi:hypothetical protein MAR_010479, partial [Mya arenaria]